VRDTLLVQIDAQSPVVVHDRADYCKLHELLGARAIISLWRTCW
jgi:hypothetical protein